MPSKAVKYNSLKMLALMSSGLIRGALRPFSWICCSISLSLIGSSSVAGQLGQGSNDHLDTRRFAEALTHAHVGDLGVVFPCHAVQGVAYRLQAVVSIWLAGRVDIAGQGLGLLLLAPARANSAVHGHFNHHRASEWRNSAHCALCVEGYQALVCDGFLRGDHSEMAAAVTCYWAALSIRLTGHREAQLIQRRLCHLRLAPCPFQRW